MKKPFLFSILILSCSCNLQKGTSLNEIIDHYEITRTTEVYNNSEIRIDSSEVSYSVVTSRNDLLILKNESSPVFREGKEAADLTSIKILLLELSKDDTLVTTNSPGKSKLIKLIYAFSPDYGFSLPHEDEHIYLKRTSSTNWYVEVDFRDFSFNGTVDFSSNQIWSTRFDDY